MASPRRVVPGTTWLITRRCARRCFFLKPTRFVTALVTFVLALFVRRYGMLLHAAVCSTTHLHLVLTDPDGRLPDFLRDTHSLLGRALNAHYGRGESAWAPPPANAVELPDPEAILDKLAYVLLNVVKDGLASRPEKWPGLCTLVKDIGTRTLTGTRPPSAFFGGRRAKRKPKPGASRKRGQWRQRPSTLPAVASCELVVPPAFAHLSLAEFHALLDERVAKLDAEIRKERRAAGKKRFMTRAELRKIDPLSSAGDVSPTFATVPSIAGGRDPALRVSRLQDLQGWHVEHREARTAWRAGDRTVQFPYGTYWLRVGHGACVALPKAPPLRA